MILDNSALVAPFCPPINDGDSFIYTEMLDRSKRKGNNGHRLVKTFYHRSVEEFWEQWPTIKHLCDLANVRACTRLAMRSYKRVGREFTKLVVDAALTDNWAGMKSLYNRACGIAPVERKLWLFDVDLVDDTARHFETALKDAGHWVATIPSKKGLHFIATPHQRRDVKGDGFLNGFPNTIQLHKDNPTNLYIPDGAA